MKKNNACSLEITKRYKYINIKMHARTELESFASLIVCVSVYQCLTDVLRNCLKEAL